MTWKTRKNGKLSAIQHCDECKKRLEPIFKCDSDPKDWMWLECDICQEPICGGCSDLIGDNYRVCVTCLQDPKYPHQIDQKYLDCSALTI